MRRLTNIVYALGFIAISGILVAMHVQERARHHEIARIAEEVRRFEQVIKLRAATDEEELTGRGWPKTIDPAWFGAEAPTNSLLTPDRPWVDVATAQDAHLLHPNDRIAADATVPMFWYNPYQGVIRTRVPPTISDAQALNLYNQLNRTELLSIFPMPAEQVPTIEAADPGAPPVIDESVNPMQAAVEPSRG